MRSVTSVLTGPRTILLIVPEKVLRALSFMSAPVVRLAHGWLGARF
jgi:hypothetical protein